MLVKLSMAGFIGAFLGGCSKTSGSEGITFRRHCTRTSLRVLLLNPLQKKNTIEN